MIAEKVYNKCVEYQKWNIGNSSKNLEGILSGPMQNMLLLIVMVTVFTMATTLIFAGILTRENLKGQDFFRVVFYIPNILSVVVISGIFSAIYDIDRGLLNSILNLFGKEGILWKGEEHVIMSLVIAMVWQAIGYYMVMYMASMSAVPGSLYESAGLDGAGRMAQFFRAKTSLRICNGAQVWHPLREELRSSSVRPAAVPQQLPQGTVR